MARIDPERPWATVQRTSECDARIAAPNPLAIRDDTTSDGIGSNTKSYFFFAARHDIELVFYYPSTTFDFPRMVRFSGARLDASFAALSEPPDAAFWSDSGLRT